MRSNLHPIAVCVLVGPGTRPEKNLSFVCVPNNPRAVCSRILLVLSADPDEMRCFFADGMDPQIPRVVPQRTAPARDPESFRANCCFRICCFVEREHIFVVSFRDCKISFYEGRKEEANHTVPVRRRFVVARMFPKRQQHKLVVMTTTAGEPEPFARNLVLDERPRSRTPQRRGAVRGNERW